MKGFTIIEIIIVIVVILILATAAISGSAGLIRSLRFNNAFNKMVFMVQQARSLAVTERNSDVEAYGVQFNLHEPPNNTIAFFADETDNSNDFQLDTAPTDETIESFQLESATGIALTAGSCLNFAVILFRNGNGEAILNCNGDTDINVLTIGLQEVEAGAEIRAKTFSIHRATGVPQI